MTAASGSTGSGRRGVLLRAAVLLLGLLGIGLGAMVATAGTTSPSITSVAPGAGYTTLTVTFSEQLASTSAGTGDLTGASFELHDAGTAKVDVTITATKKTETSYDLTVPAGKAIPNVTSVVVPSGKAWTVADKTAVPAMSYVVPLTGIDAVRAVAALATVEVDGEPFAPMPFVGSWFASLRPVTSTAGGASLRTAAGVASVGPPTTDAQSAEQELESQPLALTDMITGLGAALTSTASLTSQDAVADALEAVSGIKAVTFTNGGVQVELDPAESAGTHSSDQRTEVAALPYAVDGVTSFALHLGGTVDITLPTTGAATLQALALSMQPQAFALPATSTVGMVAVTSDAVASRNGLTLDVSCSALDCPATPTVTAGGSLDLALEEVVFSDGGGGETVDVTSGGNPVVATWSPGTWDFPDLAAITDESTPAAQALLSDLLPVVSNRAGWDAKEMPQFAQLDSHSVTLALEWVGNWLRSTDGVEALGAQLPAVGLSVGDVLELSDQVGARVTSLVDALEPDGTSPLGVPDPTAQDVLRALCAQDMLDCEGGLDGLDIETDQITYDVELDVCKVLFGDEGTCDAPAGVAVESAGPSIDLAALDAFNGDLGDLGGITATLRTGEWEGTASATLAFRLALDLRPDAVVMDDLDVTAADYPGPGFPDSARLAPGDLCRGLALQLGSTATTFAAANGELADGSPTLGCDRLAWNEDGTFASVTVPIEEPAGSRTAQVTADDVCAAAALKNGLQLSAFLALNGFDAAACATRAKEHVTTTQTVVEPTEGQDPVYPVDTGDGAAFVYYRAPADQPLPVSFRLAIEELDDKALVSADVDVSATGVGGDVSLGFLDLDLSGDISAEPSVEVGLSSDSALTLVDLARAADSATPTVTLGAMLDTELSGDLAVDLSLANDLAFPDGAAEFRLQGDIADLLAGTDLDAVSDDCDDLGDDDTGLCYELGDWPDVSEMTPAQVLRMVTGLLDQVAGLTGAGDAGFELPLVGVSVQDLVGFNSKLHDLADTIETREPESLSALQEALDAGMVAAGLPGGTVVVEVTDDVLTLSLPLGVTEEATYPFGFDVGFGDEGGMPVRISPSDGGARVPASGTATFTPTLGIDLGATVEDLDDVVFLVVDEEDDPTLGGSVTGEISGDVTFGPLTTDFSGSAAANPSVTLKLSALPGDDDGNRLTLSRIAELLEGDADLPDDFLDWDGDFSLDASVTGPVGPIELGWSATLDELLAGDMGTFTDLPSPADMLGLKLDLATLVRGTSQTTRFIGRALAESDALSTSLPLVGEELAALSAVGDDLQVFAGTVDDLYAEVEENDEEFVAGINATLDAEVCDALADVGECRAELVLFTDGDPQVVPDVTTANGVELQLVLEKEESLTLGTPKILDVPGFEVDTEADLSLRAGYRLGLTLGVDVESGFYVKGFDLADTDATRLLELYGRADINSPGGGGIKIGGVTAFTLDALDMSLGGTLGPEDDGAGFALDMPEPLTLMDVVNGRRSIDEIFEPKISVDVDAQITIGTPDGGGSIPALAFPVWFAWEMEGVIGGGLELASPSLSIGNEEEDSYVTIDVTSLVNDVVRPALLELNKYNPVAQAAPVKDALNSQVPVLDQSVRGLLDGALGGDPRWQLLSFLLDLDDVATSLADAPGATEVLIPLGGYTVLPAEDAGYFSPAADGVAYTVWDVPELKIIKDLVENLSAAAGGAKKFSKPAPVTPPKPGSWDGNLNSSSSSSFEGTPPKKPTLKQVVRMPILDNPLSAATLLFGGEVEPISFIEIAPPAVDFGMSVKFERTLFDLNLGAIEARLSVGLEGAVGVTLRVGIGYSSHGLTSGDPLNGLYLVDAYDGNRALPMVALGGRVSVRVDGRFSVVGIAEAEFSGSGYVRLEGGLDLFDESLTIPEAGRGDGMFHVDEILRVVDGHRIGEEKSAADAFCIFRPTVQLQAGLAFSATAKVLGMEVWSGSYADDWDLVDEEWSCAYVERVAQLVERTVVLAAGTSAGERLDELGDTDESFTISQAGGKLTVSGAGAFSSFRSMSFDLDGIDEVLADLGEGDDSVVVDASVTVPVKLYGGPGNDTLKGGAGDDVLDGGEGVDTIETRGGDDEVVIGADGVRDDAALTVGDGLGCTGCNVVVLGTGNDVVTGGPAPVVYRSAAGGFGHARIEHAGPTMVVDLGATTTGVDAVIDALGLHVTSPQGSMDNADPSVIARFLGSAGEDRIRVADGVMGMYVDGGSGDDVVTVETNGVDRTARVHDSGAACSAPCGDRLVVQGTTAAERILLRAHVKDSPVDGPDRSAAAAVPADEGVVAILSPESSTAASDPLEEHPVDGEALEYTGHAEATQLVFYDPSLENLLVQGVAGADEFALDDVATATTVEGGRGTQAGAEGSSFQVGQIFGWQTDEIVDPDGPDTGVAPFRRPVTPDHPVTPWGDDQFRYRESIRGWVSYGISHPTTVTGGLSDDRYTVYSNRSNLTLQGVGGDDVFTLRSFIANGSIVAAGGEGNDVFNYDFAYVSNDQVDIQGGTGFNTMVVIGTELQDGFTVTETGVSVCVPKGSAAAGLDDRVTRAPGIAALPLQPDPAAPVGATGTCGISTSATEVQRYVLAGLEGNNVFWVRGAPEGSETFLIGGRDSSTYLVGDDGDLSEVKGTIEVVADLDNLSAGAEAALRMVELDFPLPILLDGDVTYSPVAALIPDDAASPDAESTLVVDGSAMTTALSGELVRDPAPATATAGIRLTGVTPNPQGTFSLRELDGDGQPRTYDVDGGIGIQGLDTLRVVLGSGDDALTVKGTHGAYDGVGDALGRDGRTEVYAGPGADDLQLDGVHGSTWVALEEGADALRIGTGTTAGVRHPIEVFGGDGVDDVEVDASDSSVALRADLDRVPDLAPTWTGLPAAVDLTVLTGLEMPSVVRHDGDVDVFRVRTGSAADVVNARGTVAGETQLRTGADDDRVLVSSAAVLDAGAPYRLGLLGGHLNDLGDVDLDAGIGNNLLMISDRDSGLPRTVAMSAATPEDPPVSDTATVGMKAASFAVTDGPTVTFDADGGTFTRGISAWLGAEKDVVTVDGVRRDGSDLAIAGWETARPAGTDGRRTVTTLNTGAGDDVVTPSLPLSAGLLVVNLEQGDDELLGAASRRGFVAFGGDGADRLQTGGGDDVVFGDWGRVEYRSTAGALLAVLGVPDRMDLVPGAAVKPFLIATCPSQPTVDAAKVLACSATSDTSAVRSHAGLATPVRNWVSVGAGDDVAFGGAGSDWLDATDGQNALVGDVGAVQRVLAPRGTIRSGEGFLEVVLPTLPFSYAVSGLDDALGADDAVQGGIGRDWVFTGVGDDIVNGHDGDDRVFGGHGHDVLWGGTGTDHVFGGTGDDSVDLKRMAAGTGTRGGTTAGWPVHSDWWRATPLLMPDGWATFAPGVDIDGSVPGGALTNNGLDVVYGGDGQDAMQADAGGAGRVPGDRLIDWYGAHNVYYVCDGAYGAGYVLRVSSPAMESALKQLAVADGEVATSGVLRQLALVTSGNRNPTHPAHPGNNRGC